MTIIQQRPPEAPREGLTRSVPFELTRADGEGRTLVGYAAVFGEWTEVNSYEGHFLERLSPGAFAKTIKETGSRVRLQFDHGKHPMVGSIPLGVIRKLREDERGLYVEALLADNWLIQPVRDAISMGAIDGMSFRFSVERDSWTDVRTDLPRRTVEEVRLMELGPVVFPQYEGAEVGLRSKQIAEELFDADEDTRFGVARLLTFGLPEESGTREGEDEPSPEAVSDDTSKRAASENGPDDQATRSVDTYQPAQRAPMSRERRQAQIGMVRALLAQTTKE